MNAVAWLRIIVLFRNVQPWYFQKIKTKHRRTRRFSNVFRIHHLRSRKSRSKFKKLQVKRPPFVEQLLVNGTPYGSGTRFEIKSPAVGVAQVSALHQTFTPFQTTVNIAKGERTTLEVVMNVKEPLDFSPTKHLHRVPIDLDATKTALGPALSKIDNCGALADPSATMAPPTITIHTSTTGRPVGLYISSNANHKVLYSCVERIVSTIAFPTFSTGDYATIEYELSPVAPAQVN